MCQILYFGKPPTTQSTTLTHTSNVRVGSKLNSSLPPTTTSLNLLFLQCFLSKRLYQLFSCSCQKSVYPSLSLSPLPLSYFILPPSQQQQNSVFPTCFQLCSYSKSPSTIPSLRILLIPDLVLPLSGFCRMHSKGLQDNPASLFSARASTFPKRPRSTLCLILFANPQTCHS